MGRKEYHENPSDVWLSHLSNHSMDKNTHNVDYQRYILFTFDSLPDNAVKMEYDLHEVSEAEIALAIGQLYGDLSTRSKIRMMEIIQELLDKETGFLQIRENAAEVKH